jgi:acyl-CoA synthetase (AMP-forming)/AMP-acid ligase II
MTPIEALYDMAENRPTQAAMITGDQFWTYSRLVSETERLAKAMLARGVKPGDRVAMHMANVPQMVLAYHACFRIGAIAAPLNIRMKTAELRPILKQLRPALYLGQSHLYPEMANIESDVVPPYARFIVGKPVKDERVRPFERIYAGSAAEPLVPLPDADAPAILLSTSGTTGRPKLVVHTGKTLGACAEACIEFGMGELDTMLHVVPMVHASGMIVMLGSIRCGGRMIVHERFDAAAALDTIAAHRCTSMIGLPFMFADLMQEQARHARDVSSLRRCGTGGDVCPPEHQKAFAAMFGTSLNSVWSASEVLLPMRYGAQIGPVCCTASDTQVRLVDDKGVDVPRGEIGELLLRTPQMSPGYWKEPGRIESLAPDGWYHTGDLMRQGDRNDLWFVARKKNLIIRGGSNISPLEVEEVLMAHPAVRDAAVVGIPDMRLGQRVAAVVQLTADADSDALDGILAYTRAQLAEYKVPERLQVIGKVPRNAIGKVDRTALAAQLTDPEPAPVAMHA